METTNHRLELRRVGPMRDARFYGVCACGERTGLCHTAGMVHGWHADHRVALGVLSVKNP